MKMTTAVLWSFLLVSTAFSCQELEPGVSWDLARQRKQQLRNVEYDLHFELKKEGPIASEVVVRFDLKAPGKNVVLDFNAPKSYLKACWANGHPVTVTHENEHVVFSAKDLRQGPNELRIAFRAGEPSLNRNSDFLYTLLVPDRASTVFPCFDQPDLKASFRLKMSMPENWVASANGAAESEVTEQGRKTVQFRKTKPVSTYLFAFAAGEFQKVTRTIHGRQVTMLHRESDDEKVRRNLDAIFEIHEMSLKWMEDYTQIEYPFEKFDFVLIPSFQYGGMEHIGNIFYNADQLFLDKSATKNQRLNRASLIAHETAHMWFGDLVTMTWFNDVWLKEVFANFMAAKIVHPGFPEINHDLGFMLKHHPSAYNEDRSRGSYPIQQPLSNLKNAGTLYGRIIYMKAPVVMRQLETMIGPGPLQQGLQEYLAKYSYGNASWDDLIEILDRKTAMDLKEWSESWVKEPGTPVTSEPEAVTESEGRTTILLKAARTGRERLWTQQVDLKVVRDQEVVMTKRLTIGDRLNVTIPSDYDFFLVNGSELGYGYFALDPRSLRFLVEHVAEVKDDVIRGAAWLALFETMIREGREVLPPRQLMNSLLKGIARETEPLNRQSILNQSSTVYWKFLSEDERTEVAPALEAALWNWVDRKPDEKISQDAKSAYFQTLVKVFATPDSVQRIRSIFDTELPPGGLELSEADYMTLAYELALREPRDAQKILTTQLSRIKNEDRKKRFQFVMPALSVDSKERDDFFESLRKPENRRPERWALDGLKYLHHPLRASESEKYILPALEMLEEIQLTGDIFFPKRWLVETFSGHRSKSAADQVKNFLDARPEYPSNLRNKILQAADFLFRVADPH